MRNVLAHAGKQGRRVVAAFIATAFAQEDAEMARLQWRQVADQLWQPDNTGQTRRSARKRYRSSTTTWDTIVDSTCAAKTNRDFVILSTKGSFRSKSQDNNNNCCRVNVPSSKMSNDDTSIPNGVSISEILSSSSAEVSHSSANIERVMASKFRSKFPGLKLDSKKVLMPVPERR